MAYNRGMNRSPAVNWTRPLKRGLARRLRAIKPFDPYHSPLCTCRPKLTLNVYTGCGMECFYCYTSTYAWGRWGRDSDRWGPRKDVLAGVEHDLALLESAGPPLGRDCLSRSLPVVVSLSSDPYPETPRVSERSLQLTRQCLKLLADAGKTVLLQTKSDLLVRDLDVLSPDRSLIGMTITTADDALAARMEPYAPPPGRRIAALAEAARRGFPTVCRLDPLVPGVNDDPDSLRRLVAMLRDAGVRHVISSTFKKRWDSAQRFAAALPEAAEATAASFEPQQIHGYNYLNEHIRRAMLERLRDVAHDYGLAFTCCREGFPELNDTNCDGQRNKS